MNVSELITNISEDYRRLPKTFEEDPKMFRSYSNKFKYSLRVRHDISEVIDIFTSKDMVSTPPESLMWYTNDIFSNRTLVPI